LLDVSRLSLRRCDVVFLAFVDMLMLTVRVALLFDAAARDYAATLAAYAAAACHAGAAADIDATDYAADAAAADAAIYCCCRFAAITMPPPLMVSPPPLAWLTLTAAAARFTTPSDACRSHCLMRCRRHA
jgi:hypothetical protein